MKKYKIGFTQGVYDMFHIGHLNLINAAKERCDYLIVAVNSDSLVRDYKFKTPVISQANRKTIIENIRAVNKVVIADTLDKVLLHEQFGFDAVFIGDDWKNSIRWIKTERDLKKMSVDVVFLPYTPEVSSTILRKSEPFRIAE
ncbi:MAG: adenylyltransferase/cytidyltransferase family protein [Angelakisella sp.]